MFLKYITHRLNAKMKCSVLSKSCNKKGNIDANHGSFPQDFHKEFSEHEVFHKVQCRRLWFVRDTCQMMSVNIMSRARSTACSDFGTLIGLHNQRNLEWPFKSVFGNSQSQCREYRIREWFLTNFAEQLFTHPLYISEYESGIKQFDWV